MYTICRESNNNPLLERKIIRKDIVEDEYVITIPIEHPLAKKEKIYFEDIRHEDIIALSSNFVHCIVGIISFHRLNKFLCCYR